MKVAAERLCRRSHTCAKVLLVSRVLESAHRSRALQVHSGQELFPLRRKMEMMADCKLGDAHGLSGPRGVLTFDKPSSAAVTTSSLPRRATSQALTKFSCSPIFFT